MEYAYRFKVIHTFASNCNTFFLWWKLYFKHQTAMENDSRNYLIRPIKENKQWPKNELYDLMQLKNVQLPERFNLIPYWYSEWILKRQNLHGTQQFGFCFTVAIKCDRKLSYIMSISSLAKFIKRSWLWRCFFLKCC